MSTHKDLDVWKASILLAKKIYGFTENVPRREEFGLAAQMRKSAVSIASNIAEGAARRGNKEFLQFLYVALGSASELDTQLEPVWCSSYQLNPLMSCRQSSRQFHECCRA